MKSDIIKNIRFVRYGDLVMINECSLSKLGLEKQSLFDTENNAQVIEQLKVKFGCKRLALKSHITNDDFRTPNVILLGNDDSWVTNNDNGIKYTFDITKNMFCKGNIKEKIRLSRIKCNDEVVVDLFAGIGYFSMVFAVHGNAKHVYCCEWNPVAVEALKRNAKLNKVEDRVTICFGDNRKVCPMNIAHRVNMGLIPSSLTSLKTACLALDATSERQLFLHVHENLNYLEQLSNIPNNDNICKDLKNKETINQIQTIWAGDIANQVEQTMTQLYPTFNWIIKPVNVCRIKAYAPHIDHMVVDICCSHKQG